MRKVTIFGTEFSLGFGEVITKGDINKLTVSFNTGNLEWDSIRIWIANENETTAQIQYDEDYTDMYTDKTIELAGLFTEKYSETGLYVMNIRLHKGTRFLDAENVLFEYSNYEPSEMGINLPADIAFAFAPCVVSYDDSTLYTSEDTKVAKYMSVTVNGYTETREVFKGKAAIDIQQYLRTVFEGVDLWKQQNVYEAGLLTWDEWPDLRTNPLKQNVSIKALIIDKDGNTIGRAGKSLAVWYGVAGYFDRHELKKYNLGYRRRVVYWNLPCLIDVYMAPDNRYDRITINWGVTYLKNVPCIDENGEIVYYNSGETHLIDTYRIDVNEIECASFDPRGFFFYEGATNCPSKEKIFEYIIKYGIKCGTCAENTSSGVIDRYTNYSTLCYVDPCTEGVYLRWVSKYAEHCYFLFKDAGETVKTKESKTVNRVNDDFTVSELIEKQTTRTRKVGASIPGDLWELVKTLADGVFVQCYDKDKDKWDDVQIEAGTWKQGMQRANNVIEFTISYKESNIEL